MDPRLLFETLKVQLAGRRVTYRRLACDSLLLYLECEPGDGTGVTLWFEPIWHLCGQGGVLVGSMQIAHESDSEEKMDAVSEPMHVLEGQRVESLSYDSRTFDLTVTFEGDCSIKTFVSDATSEESWHIRDNTTCVRLKGSPKGLGVVAPPSPS